MSIRRKSARKMSVKTASPTENASPASPRIDEIACGIESATFVAPCWTFSPAPESPAHDSSPESRNCSTMSRKALHEVPQRADERDEQEESEHGDDDRRAEHDDRRGDPPPPLRPAYERAQRDLEHEGEEDAEEDEDQRVADRDDRGRERGDGRREQQRTQCDRALGPPPRAHGPTSRRSGRQPAVTAWPAGVTACRPGPDGGP